MRIGQIPLYAYDKCTLFWGDFVRFCQTVPEGSSAPYLA